MPKRKEYFASIGLRESKVTSIDASGLDSKYLLAKTDWRMTFERPAGSRWDIGTSATYILERTGEKLMIVFQIDHQDLNAKVKELGLA